MKLLEFPEQTDVIAKNQKEYHPMPCHRAEDFCCTTTILWGLSWRERLVVLFTGRVWHQILTFHKAMQPQRLMADKPI